MIAGDLDTEVSSNHTAVNSSLVKQMLQSIGLRSRTGTTVKNRPPQNQKNSHEHSGTDTYSACLASISCFIHDGDVCVDEADDPYNAICFFHPPNHTPTEQWEFTGPIVGAVHFMTSFANTPPKIIQLANSSIALLCFDNYTIALKACKVLSPTSLEACLRDLYNVFSLFYNDLKYIRKVRFSWI